MNGVNLKYFVVLFTSIILFSCSSVKEIKFDLPREFVNSELESQFYDSYKNYFQGYTFFLDPGHGGEDRKNKGYKGITIEADATLRIGLYLREYLLRAGAKVIMSRDKDTSVVLKDRSLIANNSGADFFISIHTNAPGQEGDDWTNYTSTYYHAKEIDFEFEPMTKDMAKFVQRDLAYAMRNSGGLGSFDGTYSDYNIYPGKGFSVLRLTTIPAVLIEAGFHTHHFEELRLADTLFNKVQAWGIFRGIARYLKAGIPKISFIEKKNNSCFYLINDSIKINPNSIKVWEDSVEIKSFLFDELKSIVTVNLNNNNEEKYIRIVAANINGNHSFPFHHKFRK